MNAHLGAITVVVALALSVLSGCERPSESQAQGRVPGACKMRGNGDAPPTCMTSISSVLAAPERYEGMKVSFGAWVDQINDVVLVFPSEDAMGLRDTASSMVIYPEKNVRSEDRSLSGLSGSARFVRVTGFFYRIEDGVRNSRVDPVDSGRFGVLEGVTIED